MKIFKLIVKRGTNEGLIGEHELIRDADHFVTRHLFRECVARFSEFQTLGLKILKKS